jgi:CheY-like chemotaxis protein
VAKTLVAEDEKSVRNLASGALQLHDHEVTAVVDGSAALWALSQGEFDLLLTDIVMPVTREAVLIMGNDGLYYCPDDTSQRVNCPHTLWTI